MNSQIAWNKQPEMHEQRPEVKSRALTAAVLFFVRVLLSWKVVDDLSY